MSECPQCGHHNSPGSRFCARCGAGLAIRVDEDRAAYNTPVAPGTIFDGKYQVLQEIGRGGMGVVYRGHDLSLGRMVAIKVLPEQFNTDDEVIARFKKEARAMAALDHPNVVPVYAIGQQRNFHYFVMKFLEGSTVAELIDEMKRRDPHEVRFHPRQVHNVIIQACRGLGHAHRRGLVHRDIKPGNLMVSPDNHVTIMDFGIVKEASAPEGENLTRTGMVFGTPEYMAPEQAQGQGVPGPTADLYSLGVVAYEMLTGEPPFKGDTPFSVVLKHIKEPPTPLLQQIPEISGEFQAAIFRAMEKAPEHRYPNAEVMAETLTAINPTHGSTSLPPAAVPYVSQPPGAMRPPSAELPPIMPRMPRPSADLPPLRATDDPPSPLLDVFDAGSSIELPPEPVELPPDPSPGPRSRVITINDEPVPDFEAESGSLTPFVHPGAKPFGRASTDVGPVADGEISAFAKSLGDLFEGPVAPPAARAITTEPPPVVAPPSAPPQHSPLQLAREHAPSEPAPPVVSPPVPAAVTNAPPRVASPSRPLPHIPVRRDTLNPGQGRPDPAVLEDRPGHYRHLVTAHKKQNEAEQRRRRTMTLMAMVLLVGGSVAAWFLAS